jgi:hypothetical protein
MPALAGLRAGVRVTGLAATAENVPSGSGMHPGDVITHHRRRARFVPDGDEAKGATGFGTRLLFAWPGGLSPA